MDSSFLPPEAIFHKKEETGWGPADGFEGAQARQWAPSANPESFAAMPPSGFHYPWQASGILQREFPPMLSADQAPPLNVFLAPTPTSNGVYSTPFPLATPLLSYHRAAENSPSYDACCSAFDACAPFRSSTFVSTESFDSSDSFTAFGHFASVGAPESPSGVSASSSDSGPSFNSFTTYGSPNIEYIPTPAALACGVEHPDSLRSYLPFAYNDGSGIEEDFSCSKSGPGDYTSSSVRQLRHTQSGQCSSHGNASRESQMRSSRVRVEPTSSSTKALKKTYQCYPCGNSFDRHEHLTRHKLTVTHRRTLEDQGIPCFDPLPQMVTCPFCPKRFNRRDNLKPHIFTHMHLPGENKRNKPISIEDSVRKGQASIDPRLKPLSGVKRLKKKAHLRSRLRRG